jgi:hypothetical protein
MIRFACPACRSVLEAPNHKAGKKLACPKCAQRIQIPGAAKPKARNVTVLGSLVGVLKGSGPKTSAESQGEGTNSNTQATRQLRSTWFYTKDGKSKIGPVSSDALRKLASDGKLLPTDMVLKEGTTKWVAAAQLAGLFGAPPPHVPPRPNKPTKKETPPAVAQPQRTSNGARKGNIVKASAPEPVEEIPIVVPIH